jgi:D-alanine transaminase
MLMPEPIANLNGQQMPLSEVRISPLDRGFLFGDAVYEVIRVYEGRPFLFDEHLQRLGQSLKAIRIDGIDLERLRQRVLKTIAAGPFVEATVYIQVTRGSAPRGHGFPKEIQPLEFLYVREFEDPYVTAREQGAAVITTPDLRWERCDIKSTNLLANVLAAQTAKEAGAVEAVFHLPDGTLTEGTHTSFFGVLSGTLLTAPQSPAILPGITRSLILRIAAEERIPVRELTLKLADLPQVSELFLTGTTSEVLPIVRVDERQIGTGVPGPITRRLQAGYRRAARPTGN